MMGSISIWDWSVMFPGAKNRFRLSGGFCWQILLFQISSGQSLCHFATGSSFIGQWIKIKRYKDIILHLEFDKLKSKLVNNSRVRNSYTHSLDYLEENWHFFTASVLPFLTMLVNAPFHTENKDWGSNKYWREKRLGFEIIRSLVKA